LYTAYGAQFMIGSCQTIAVEAKTIRRIGMGGPPDPRPHEHGDEQEHHHDRPDLMQNEPVVHPKRNSTGRGTPVTSGLAMRGETAPMREW
jgi:hypothetical protein